MPAATQIIEVGGVEVEATWKPVKALRLRVLPPDAVVRLSVPLGVPGAEARRFVAAQLPWIARARDHILKRASGRAPLVDGGRVPLWGSGRALRVSNAGRTQGRFDGETIWLTGPDEPGLRRALEALYRRELEPVARELCHRWAPELGRTPTRLRLRRMKTRWGTCRPATGVITINTALAERLPEQLEYVVLHELVHLREPGHGPAFQAQLDALMLSWRQRQAALREAPCQP